MRPRLKPRPITVRPRPRPRPKKWSRDLNIPADRDADSPGHTARHTHTRVRNVMLTVLLKLSWIINSRLSLSFLLCLWKVKKAKHILQGWAWSLGGEEAQLPTVSSTKFLPFGGKSSFRLTVPTLLPPSTIVRKPIDCARVEILRTSLACASPCRAHL